MQLKYLSPIPYTLSFSVDFRILLQELYLSAIPAKLASVGTGAPVDRDIEVLHAVLHQSFSP